MYHVRHVNVFHWIIGDELVTIRKAWRYQRGKTKKDNREYNGQKKKVKMTNSYLQNIQSMVICDRYSVTVNQVMVSTIKL
jgi:hypothetical protein